MAWQDEFPHDDFPSEEELIAMEREANLAEHRLALPERAIDERLERDWDDRWLDL